jgi:hypothetical protein
LLIEKKNKQKGYTKKKIILIFLQVFYKKCLTSFVELGTELKLIGKSAIK